MNPLASITQHPELRPHKQRIRADLRFALRWALRHKPHWLPGRLVVSLTSYPKRFKGLATTLKTLLSQEVRPDFVVLWIYKDDAHLLPPNVLRLRSKGLSIRIVDVDMRSYLKLVPALAEFDDAYIVTADDDIYYPRDWLSMLVSAVKPERREVVGLRGRWIEFEADGSFAPYRSWKFLENETPASARVLLTGVGGTLYPPNCFAAEVADVKKFLSLSPSTDDLWFYFLLRKNGYVSRKVGGWIPSEIVEGSQQQSLWAINEGGENDRAWNRLVEAFGCPTFAEAALCH